MTVFHSDRACGFREVVSNGRERACDWIHLDDFTFARQRVCSSNMAGFHSQRDDSSLQSIQPPQDLSLGSFGNLSGLSTPAKGMRIPSSSTVPSSAPLATPTPPRVSSYIRKKLEDGATPVAKKLGVVGTDTGADDYDDDGDILNSMQRDRKFNDELGSASVERGKRSRTSTANGKSNNLTLRDQEKVRVYRHG